MSPSPFIVEWIERIARERGGASARAGRRDGPRTSRGGAGARRVPDLRRRPAAGRGARGDDGGCGARASASRGWCADLTQHPLPRGRFDLVVVCRYLQRDLFPALRAAVAPGGVVIYETFTTRQRALGRPPTSAGSPARARRAAGGASTASRCCSTKKCLAPDAWRGSSARVAQLIEGLRRQRDAARMRRAVRFVRVIVGAARHGRGRSRSAIAR